MEGKKTTVSGASFFESSGLEQTCTLRASLEEKCEGDLTARAWNGYHTLRTNKLWRDLLPSGEQSSGPRCVPWGTLSQGHQEARGQTAFPAPELRRLRSRGPASREVNQWAASTGRAMTDIYK